MAATAAAELADPNPAISHVPPCEWMPSTNLAILQYLVIQQPNKYSNITSSFCYPSSPSALSKFYETLLDKYFSRRFFTHNFSRSSTLLVVEGSTGSPFPFPTHQEPQCVFLATHSDLDNFSFFIEFTSALRTRHFIYTQALLVTILLS